MGTNGRTGRKRYRKRNSKHTASNGYAIHDPESIVLLKWAKRNGISYGKLCPANFPQTGRGLMTNKRLRSGDLVISVPESMLISSKTANQSKIGKQLSELNLKPALSVKQMLCSFLLYEKYRGRTSFWYPYIKTLPKSFNTPAYFSEEEIQPLPFDLQHESGVQVTTVRESYKGFKECLEEHSTLLDGKFVDFVTFDEFRWAWFVVNTRSVYKADSKQTDCNGTLQRDNAFALAPVLDLLNHMDTAEVNAGFNIESNKYEIYTMSCYNKGDQVFINYGPHDNRKLLLEYGFILPKNVQNIVTIPRNLLYSVVVPKISGLSRRKKEVISCSQLDKDLFCSGDSGLSWSTLVLLRILAMDEESFKRNWEKVLTGEKLSNEIELKVAEWKESLLQKILECYKEFDRNTSHSQEHGCMSENMQLTLQLRNQEIQILTNALEMVDP